MSEKIPTIKSPEGKKQKFFELLVDGEFAPDQLEMKEVVGSLKRSPESETILESEWKKFLASGVKPWPNDTKPSRYHFTSAKVENGKLIISVDPSMSYRDAIGARSPELLKLGREYVPTTAFANILLIAKTKSGQEKLGITLRNTKQDYKPGGYLPTTGGSINLKNKETPFQAALRECKEEIGVEPEELENLVCRGIIFNPAVSGAVIYFLATTKLTVEEVLSRHHDDENQTIFIPTKIVEFQKWLLASAHANTGEGIAAMLLLGK